MEREPIHKYKIPTLNKLYINNIFLILKIKIIYYYTNLIPYRKTNTIYIMRFSWNETIILLCLLSSTICICAELISEYTGINSWAILYFGIGLFAVAILLIILRFNRKKK